MRRHNLSFRKCTHQEKFRSSKLVQEKIDTVLHNARAYRKKFEHPVDMILNMDETACFFYFSVKTIQQKDQKCARQLQLGQAKKKVTCVLTATASGKILKPMIIFNDKKVLNLDPSDYETDPEFCYSERGWMDGDLMLIWSKRIILWGSLMKSLSRNIIPHNQGTSIDQDIYVMTSIDHLLNLCTKCYSALSQKTKTKKIHQGIT